jgi:hypothetical protein
MSSSSETDILIHTDGEILHRVRACSQQVVGSKGHVGVKFEGSLFIGTYRCHLSAQ